MKISCLSVSLFPAISNGEVTIKEYATLCRDLGLDGFDLGIILLKNHTPTYINQVKKDIAEVGLKLIMLTTYPDFTHPDFLQREREFDYLVRDIALASALDAKFLRITAGQAHPETGETDGINWAVSYLKKAATIADKYDITLLFEDHAKPGAWHYMDFANPPHIFLEIARQLKETSIGINFDTANILVSGHNSTLEILDQVIDQVKTIHVAETGSMGKMDPKPIGSGIVPFTEIFRYLKSKNYDGWLCLEEWGNNGPGGVKEAVAFVKETWEKA
ncbi:sugar phosphate isomerase/epimerase family protein [Adhaeribacter aquaticus]|uniref:sugar phosphate isomerase/epimerase family protein n=1 Tax=Adhaeribacter aquaticus TaxID=299567 RepID=UPI0004238EF3|nr:sugar phosphate isomerase/epimerase family protein [Adhaeribacter aquaticus]